MHLIFQLTLTHKLRSLTSHPSKDSPSFIAMPSADYIPDTSIFIDNPFLILYPEYQNYPLPNLSTTPFMPPEHQAGTPSPSPSNPHSSASTPQQEPSSRSSNPGTPLSHAQSSLLTLNTRLPTVSTPPTLPQKIIGICCVPYLNLRKRAKSSPAKGFQSPPIPPPASSEATAPIGISSPEGFTATRISSYESFPPPSFDLNGQPRALDSKLYPEEVTASSPSSSNPARTGIRAKETSPRIVPNFSRPRHRASTTPGDQHAPAPSALTAATITPASPPASQATPSSSNRNNIPPSPPTSPTPSLSAQTPHANGATTAAPPAALAFLPNHPNLQTHPLTLTLVDPPTSSPNPNHHNGILLLIPLSSPFLPLQIPQLTLPLNQGQRSHQACAVVVCGRDG